MDNYETGIYTDNPDDTLRYMKSAEVVEVVRCKDCKWFDGYTCCDKNGLFVGFNYETFFCADGERRSE